MSTATCVFRRWRATFPADDEDVQMLVDPPEAEIIYARTYLRLCVRDNGCGIDPRILERGGVDNHFGLTAMKERAKKVGGEFRIRNRADGGAEIVVRLSSRLAYKG